ncbi:helix-turn-helix domain-containing protein [Bordetella hinzii]|uniref:helix-turn-helix domain-containing protein n=1 Tax=Bordetella hinzii TaxID=103855 RepID=UPI0009B815B4|nr:helix-turn-helix domain-containing protein [Bordetella hinzii]
MTTLAERLAEAMKDMGVTAADLARATGAKPPSVFKWVHGQTKNLRGNNLVVVASLLNVSESWLADGRGPKERKAALWPFSAPYEAYESLDSDQRKTLDNLVTGFLAGAASAKSTAAEEAA